MRRAFSFNRPTLLLCVVGQILGFLLPWLFCIPIEINAQVTAISPTPAGAGGLRTIITPSAVPENMCSANCVITGGTRPGGGGNLFHSFGQFNIGAGDIATFQNGISFDANGTALAAGLPTSSILARVTGINGNNPSLSSVYGTLQTSGFGTANLFMMNPAGFLFGAGATVNVGGMVAFTSADYLRLQDINGGNAGTFHADATRASVLSTAPVASYGFLGSNPGAITVQGSQLTVTPGQSVSLVGGNITIQSGTLDNGTVQPALLSAQGGQINLASVASPGEVVGGSLTYQTNVNGQSFGTLGSINISEQSVIDVTGNGGGTVLIRGGQFLLDNSTILANVTGPGPVINGAESIRNGIDIQVTGNAVIQNLGVLETNVGNATPGVTYGGVHVKADRVEIHGTASLNDFLAGTADFSAFTGIRSDVLPESTGGNSGNITLEANSILISDFGQLEALNGQSTFSDTGLPGGVGNPGNIKVTAIQDLTVEEVGQISTGLQRGTGNAGNIELASANGSIAITTGAQVGSQALQSSGNTGLITLNAPHGDILLAENVTVGSLIDGDGALGGIQITANNLHLNGGVIGPASIIFNNFSSSPNLPGDITITLSGNLSLNGEGSTIFTNALSETPAANVNITAHDVSVAGGSFLTTGSQQTGRGGTLNIFADTIEVTTGGQIQSRSSVFPQFDFATFTFVPAFPSGPGGTINIQGHSGPATSVLVDGAGSGIITNSQGSGKGGTTNISAQSVTIQNGGVISAQANGSAPGGQVNISTDNLQLTNGGQITSGSVIAVLTDFPFAGQPLPTPSGAAGAITIQGLTGPAGSVLIDGAGSGIFTNTVGTGAGGNTTMSVQSLTIQNSGTISGATSGTALSATGGSINITTTNGVTMTNDGLITASSTGPGDAGNIFVNAGPQLEMQNSSIKTEAAQAGGGNIEIQALDLVQLGDSTISTSVLGGAGSGGNITIDPNAVVLQNSQILAQAVQGAGGNISITTNLLLPDSTSIISASSQFGQQGNIVIQSPVSPASGKLLPLGQKPLVATALLSQRCAALAGGNASSFTVAGRDSLPAEPGGWVSSPLALSMAESNESTATETALSSLSEMKEGTPLLSLRKVAPAGFLSQSFAVDSSDCQS